MTPMLATGPFELLHLVGFLTGALLYGMLLVMVTRQPARPDAFAFSTGLLGLVWNVGELGAYAAKLTGLDAVSSWVHASSFSALGLLASVVVHSVARAPFKPKAQGTVQAQGSAPCRGYRSRSHRVCVRRICGRHALCGCSHNTGAAVGVRVDCVDSGSAGCASGAHHRRPKATQ
jgi:hypothetical protein